MRLKLHNPDAVAAPLRRFTHAVETPAGAASLFLSGHVPVAPDGAVGATPAEQADQGYARIVAVLAARGAPPTSIVTLTTVLAEDDDGDDRARKARERHRGERRPASTAVFVTRLVDPAWKIEIDAIAPMS